MMLSRRAFLTASTALALPSTTRSATTGSPVLRRSIGSMGADDPDLVAYRQAVKLMKTLPAGDWKNWLSQANIHQHFCPHRNWYFLPWHRAYLAAFERICQHLSGKADFALPYWDWTVDRLMPAAFSSGTPATNPLNHERPGFGPTDSLPDDMVGTDVITSILNSSDYESFGSTRPTGQDSTDGSWQRRPGQENQLEYNPHDGVHGTLSGDMGQVALSSRDPIFWLHHCNIDRLWANWVARGHSNSIEPTWHGFRFQNQFYNVDGSMWDVGVSDVVSTLPLGYHYGLDVEPVALDPALVARLEALRRIPTGTRLGTATLETVATGLPGPPIQLAGATNTMAATRQHALSIPVGLGRDVADVLKPAPLPQSGTDVTALAAPQRVIATITGIEPPKDLRTRVRVFVNCDYLTPATPLSDPHYVTSFSFFEMQASDMSMPMGGKTISVDLTAALSRVARADQLQGEQVIVQLLPSGKGEAAATSIKPARVDVAIL